jgi:hypothetical protein
MPGFEFGEGILDVATLALPGLLQTLSDTLVRVGLGGDVEEPLVGPGILHNRGSLAFNREHHGALALPELLHGIPGAPAKREDAIRLGIIDENGRLLKRELPEDMREGAGADFGG